MNDTQDHIKNDLQNLFFGFPFPIHTHVPFAGHTFDQRPYAVTMPRSKTQNLDTRTVRHLPQRSRSDQEE
jgi:hypothetical protein